MIRVRHKGNFKRTEQYLKNLSNIPWKTMLERYGQAGVDALSSETPKQSGVTAASWSYEIVRTSIGYSIYWNNSNIQNGVNVAILLRFGHGTGTGGYVQGIDYVSPALRPVFEKMAEDAWKEVKNA